MSHEVTIYWTCSDGTELELTASGVMLPPERAVGIMDWDVQDFELNVDQASWDFLSDAEKRRIEDHAVEFLIESYIEGEVDEYEPDCD